MMVNQQFNLVYSNSRGSFEVTLVVEPMNIIMVGFKKMVDHLEVLLMIDSKCFTLPLY